MQRRKHGDPERAHQRRLQQQCTRARRTRRWGAAAAARERELVFGVRAEDFDEPRELLEVAHRVMHRRRARVREDVHVERVLELRHRQRQRRLRGRRESRALAASYRMAAC